MGAVQTYLKTLELLSLIPRFSSLGLKSHLDFTHWVCRALGIQELELMITIRGHITQPAVQYFQRN